MLTIVVKEQFQICFTEYALCISVIIICQSGAGEVISCITIAVRPRLRRSRKKQLVRISRCPRVTVGRIYKIVLSIVHLENIPHVRIAVASYNQISACKNAFNTTVKHGMVTEIFERLSISLTDNISTGVSIKDPYHLPWISITRPACGGTVIRNKHADFILICTQFFFI